MTISSALRPDHRKSALIDEVDEMNQGNRIQILAVGLVGLIAASAGHAAPIIYGQLNLSFDNLDNGTDSALNVSSNASWLGVKGDIQADGGISGIYQIESEVNIDTGSTSANNTALASRNSFLGLQGNFGTQRLGRFDTPVKSIGRQVGLFKNQVGDARNLTRGSDSTAKFDERPNNSIAYTSPMLSGFKAILQYATNTDSGAAANNDGELISAAVNYAQGPAFIGLGYEKHGYVSTATPPVAGSDPSVVRLAGYYDLSGWRLSALWQTIAGTVSSKDEDVYGIGVRCVNKAWTFKTQAYQLDSNAADMNATLLAVGSEYALHKSIILYADYAMLNNDARQTLTPYKEGHSDNLAVSVSGSTATGISLGTIIKF